jgi:hypothetical protein
MKSCIYIFLWHNYSGLGRLIVDMSISHTVRHPTLSRVPLDDGSARRRDLYLTTHNHTLIFNKSLFVFVNYLPSFPLTLDVHLPQTLNKISIITVNYLLTNIRNFSQQINHLSQTAFNFQVSIFTTTQYKMFLPTPVSRCITAGNIPLCRCCLFLTASQ